MIPIEANFPNKNQKKGERCEKCGEIEDMSHVYTCDTCQGNKMEYENIFGENTKMIRKVYEIFKTNYENKEYPKKFIKSPRDPLCHMSFTILIVRV